MPISTPYTGTATVGAAAVSLVSGTTTLQTVTSAPGVYQVVVDLAALASGDAYDLSIYDAAAAGGAKRMIVTQRVTGPIPDPLLVMPSMLLVHGWDVTLAKASGTDRAVSWSLHRVA